MKTFLEQMQDVYKIERKGLRIIHINNGHGERGCTIAYRALGDLIRVAVAWKHPNDQFNKKIGYQRAIELWDNKESILLPAHTKFKPAPYLRFIFR